MDCHAVAGRIGQDRAATRQQPQHLAPRGTVAAVNQHLVADGCTVKTRHLGKAAARFHHPADLRDRGGVGNLGKKAVKNSGHGILPLFALNRF